MRGRDIVEVVGLVAAVTASVAAWWSALESRHAAEETRRGTKASVLLQLLDDYGSGEMLGAMIALRSFRTAHGADTEPAFEALLDAEAETGTEVPATR